MCRLYDYIEQVLKIVIVYPTISFFFSLDKAMMILKSYHIVQNCHLTYSSCTNYNIHTHMHIYLQMNKGEVSHKTYYICTFHQMPMKML